MAKNFAPRVSKKKRKTLNLSDKLDKDLLKLSEERLFEDADLEEVPLKEIDVKSQVRTKFDERSIRDLAKNIEANGLIQPLVVHKKNGKMTLICGERRFRAMSSIDMESAPCFILKDKTPQELMAIQFSENSSREELHYIDKADGILNYQKATKASERKIKDALGISKSEVHRSLLIAKMGKRIKEAAKKHNIEKYVLLEYDALESSPFKKKVYKLILNGEVTKRSQLKRLIKNGDVLVTGKKKTTNRKKPALPKGLTANAFLKAMNTKSKDMKMDKKTREMLKTLLNETKDMVDF